MTATPSADPTSPSLAEQVSRLYDLIAGYHLTNLIEVAREVGAWDRITARPGIDSRTLAAELRTDPDYTDVVHEIGPEIRSSASTWRSGLKSTALHDPPIGVPPTATISPSDSSAWSRSTRADAPREDDDISPTARATGNGDAYREYAARTGRFLPWIGRLSPNGEASDEPPAS